MKDSEQTIPRFPPWQERNRCGVIGPIPMAVMGACARGSTVCNYEASQFQNRVMKVAISC